MANIDQLLGNAPKPNANQVKAALLFTIAVSEAIRELGSVPAGHMYAQLMNRIDLQGFEGLVRNLVNAGLVRKDGDLLVWVGPMLEAK